MASMEACLPQDLLSLWIRRFFLLSRGVYCQLHGRQFNRCRMCTCNSFLYKHLIYPHCIHSNGRKIYLLGSVGLCQVVIRLLLFTINCVVPVRCRFTMHSRSCMSTLLCEDNNGSLSIWNRLTLYPSCSHAP